MLRKLFELLKRSKPDVKVAPLNYSIKGAFLSDTGCVRETNEDNGIYYMPETREEQLANGILLMVADGMGGHSSGEIASKMAVDIIKAGYFSRRNSSKHALVKAVTKANKRIYDYSQSNSQQNGMGTTCTAIVLKNGKIFLAHVGDSRLYILRDDELYQLTEDHSTVNSLVKQGILTREEARDHPDKNIIERALGTAADVEVASWEKPFSARVGDKFIVCSDGLSDMVEDAEIEKIMVGNNYHEACKALINLARERGGYDNITVGIIFLEPLEAIAHSSIRKTRQVEKLMYVDSK